MSDKIELSVGAAHFDLRLEPKAATTLVRLPVEVIAGCIGGMGSNEQRELLNLLAAYIIEHHPDKTGEVQLCEVVKVSPPYGQAPLTADARDLMRRLGEWSVL